MVATAQKIPLEEIETTESELITTLMLSAWEIVEYGDTFRQLVKLRFPDAAPGEELADALKACGKLRNSKVHIAQNVKNLSQKSGAGPLHEMLKWSQYDAEKSKGQFFHIPFVSVEPMPYVDVPHAPTAKITHGRSFQAQDGIRSVPQGVSNFNLIAFADRINLTRLVELLEVYNDALADLVEQAVAKEKMLATEQGSELLETSQWSHVSSHPIRWVVTAAKKTVKLNTERSP